MEPAALEVSVADLGLPGALPMPARRDWRIGMVGFGSIARHAHAPAYRQAGWPIVAVADPSEEARRCAAEQFGVGRVYEDHRDLVADPEVEVVDLLTQPTIREEVVAEAARAGKPLITEKPFARSVDECERMVALAERAGTALAVHQNYRWMATNYAVRGIVERGLVGEPFLASIEIYGTQDQHLGSHPFYATCDDFITVQWNNHLVDLLRYWTGRDPVQVLARTARKAGQHLAADALLCSIHDFGSGLTGHILHHELLGGSMASQPCRIDGDAGSVTFDLWGQEVYLESAALCHGVRRLDLTKAGFLPSFAGSMGDFLIALEQGGEPAVSGRRNLPTIRTVLAEHRSALAGGVWTAV